MKIFPKALIFTLFAPFLYLDAFALNCNQPNITGQGISNDIREKIETDLNKLVNGEEISEIHGDTAETGPNDENKVNKMKQIFSGQSVCSVRYRIEGDNCECHVISVTTIPSMPN